jgi:hypothetical protein
MSAGPDHDYDPMQPAGSPPPDRHGMRSAWRGSRRAAVLAGVIGAGLLAGAGAGVAFAATGSPGRASAPQTFTATTPSPSPSAPSAKTPPGMHRFPFRFGHSFGPGGFAFGGPLSPGGPFGAIHGQYVAPKPGGGYQTVDFQNGKVTAVSSTSITLRSADGYTHSYTVTGSTIVDAQRGGISSIKTGNEASVGATVSGSTATATSVRDLTLLQQNAKNFFGTLPGGSFKKVLP